MAEQLKVGWVGYGGNSWMAEDLRPVIEKLGMTLFTIHEHDNADIKWEKDNWFNHLKKADIVIAPANYKKQPAKSANRLIQSMSMGKPVICSPLPAYLDVAKKHPGSFLLADVPEEWEECLKLLRDNPSFRKQMSEKALEAVEDFSINVIGNKWLELLEKDVPIKKDTESNKVLITDIIIPTYKNLRGLKLCIESILECTLVPYNIIIVNNGTDEELHNYCSQLVNVTYIKKDRLNFAQAMNVGIKAGDSDLVVLLNDDVIVSKGWLMNLKYACTEDVGAVGPLSNCDKSWLHNHDINIGGVELLPGSNTFEQIEPIISQIYNYESPFLEEPERKWVAFYATLIPRSVIEEVGFLDESFTNSGEDVDYCNRIMKLGYKIKQTYKSFVFHFGAVSRKLLEQEDKGTYQKADEETQEYLKIKYSKPTVIIYSGASWERWSYKSLEQGGIGGSEVWQINVCRELNKLGYRVISFNDSPEKEMWEDGIQYLHYGEFSKWCDGNYADYAIISRTTDPLHHPLRAGKIFIMVHDVWLLSARDQLFLDKVDKFCVLSKWHWDFFKGHHGIQDESKLALTSNGIDFNRYDNKNIERHPYKMFYSSSPDRGLDTLLYLFPFIKEKIPELELHIYYGFNNWEKAVKMRKNQIEIDRMNKIKKDMEQPGVFYHGRVGQKELAEAQLECSLWAYPTDFEEVFCITAIEAQRARIPVLATNYAALQTTVGDSGILIGNGMKGESYTRDYRLKFVDECIKVLTDKEYREHWIEKGLKNTEKYSWEQVAKNWKKLFEKSDQKVEAKIIDEKEYKKDRVLVHEMKISSNYMPDPHSHLNNERDRFHYYKTLNAFVSSNSCSALDVGCFDGWIDFLLIEQGFKLTGVELMEPLVQAARKYAEVKQLDYTIYQGFFEEIEIDQKFDLVICLETLEHIDLKLVPEYIQKMKSLATKGLFISLPDQKHEDNTQHLWTPTENLIRKMWGNKKNFSLEYHTYQDSNLPANWLIYFEV